MAVRCSGRFIKDFEEHLPTCERCAEAAAMEGMAQCSVCGLAMRDDDMENHMRQHTGERPFRCAICLKTFPLKCSLAAHLRLHYDERPFACADCGKRFRQGSSLRQHRSVHTSERPFACSDCAKTYKRACGLNRHKQRAHGYHYTCRRCPAKFDTRLELVAHYVQHREAFRRGPDENQ